MTDLTRYYSEDDDSPKPLEPVNCKVCNGGPNGHTLSCPVLNVRKDVLDLEAVEVKELPKR
jgi:hypothetical protein